MDIFIISINNFILKCSDWWQNFLPNILVSQILISEAQITEQSFIPHFLNSRFHFFQCIFLGFKEFGTPSVKLPFELSGSLDFIIVEPLKKLLMSFVTRSLLSFCFCAIFPLEISSSTQASGIRGNVEINRSNWCLSEGTNTTVIRRFHVETFLVEKMFRQRNLDYTVLQSLIPYFQSLHSLIPQLKLNFAHSQSLILQFLQF